MEELSLLVQLEKWEKAVPLAIKLDDVSTAAVIVNKCPDKALREEVDAHFQ